MNFKVGDRVVNIFNHSGCSDDEVWVGTVDQVFHNGDVHIKGDKGINWVDVSTEIQLESVYNSPLFKLMKEIEHE